MAQNYNNNALSSGNIYVFNGVECVKWAADRFEHTTLTENEFIALSGNDISFLEEWAINRYPILCNGWLIECNAAHINDDGVFSAMFIVNNAVCPDLTGTFGVMLLTAQNSTVSCEIVNLVKESEAPEPSAGLPNPLDLSTFKDAYGVVLNQLDMSNGEYQLVGSQVSQNIVKSLIFNYDISAEDVSNGMMAAYILSAAFNSNGGSTPAIRPITLNATSSSANKTTFYPVYGQRDFNGSVVFTFANYTNFGTLNVVYLAINPNTTTGITFSSHAGVSLPDPEV